MSSADESLARLCKVGSLKEERPDEQELTGLLRSARVRLGDARLPGLSAESRFDLGYNASHALALAALRRRGYRSDSRYLVFQCLPHTLGAADELWRVLALCHERRNRAEYEGIVDIDDQLVEDLLAAADELLQRLDELGPLSTPET